MVHAAGGYTAWSDKHPSYSAVSGPGNGTNIDDYYAPEINSIPVALPGVTTPCTALSCNPLPDQTAVAPSNAWTDSFQNIQCYDTAEGQRHPQRNRRQDAQRQSGARCPPSSA